MASYPTAVKSFTSKTSGQTIAPAHVNDLQDEANAIEGGLLNGIAHNLNADADNTRSLGSSGTRWNIAADQVSGRPASCRLTSSAAIGVASGAFAGLNWDVETFDGEGMHSTATNSSRISFVHSTGVYAIGANVEWNTNSSGTVAIRLVLGDSTNIAGEAHPAAPGGAVDASAIHTLIDIPSTSHFATVQVFQNSGSTRSLAASGNYATTFYAFRVSR